MSIFPSVSNDDSVEEEIRVVARASAETISDSPDDAAEQIPSIFRRYSATAYLEYMPRLEDLFRLGRTFSDMWAFLVDKGIDRMAVISEENLVVPVNPFRLKSIEGYNPFRRSTSQLNLDVNETASEILQKLGFHAGWDYLNVIKDYFTGRLETVINTRIQAARALEANSEYLQRYDPTNDSWKFTLTTHAKDLTIFSSMLCLFPDPDAPDFGAPSPVVTGWLRAGPYKFGGESPTFQEQWDKEVFDIPWKIEGRTRTL